MPDDKPAGRPLRIAVFSRYNLADQYDLAAEFRSMLKEIAARDKVFHLSLGGPKRLKADDIPAGLIINELPISIDRNNPRDMLVKSLLMYLLLPLAAGRLRKFKPDLIFLSEVLPMAGLFLKLFCRTRVATGYGDWHIHNMLSRTKWSAPILKLMEGLDRFESRRLDGFLCRAVTAGERLKSWGVNPELIRVIRDAPDPSAFYPREQKELRHRCGFQDDDIVLLYHGVMHSGKGLDKLLIWTNELYRENQNIGIILVGGGPEQTSLRKLASGLELGRRAFFTGWLKTVKEVGDYCNAADICVAMRTAAEANMRVVPGALLHSMACRKVVIGPALSGIAEILKHGQNGFMFKPDDGDDFKALIRELIQNRSKWQPVAERAYRDIQEKHSVAAAASQYAQALDYFAGM
ncbi:MAG: glycosyltransferase [Kiritimatiellia bacterium]|nr:glycosyltransferase [Kiritimatiellia bacterium]